MGSKIIHDMNKDTDSDSGFDVIKLLNRRHDKQPPAVVDGTVREVSYQEIDDYLELQNFNSFRIALGVMFCIDSPVVAILIDGFDMGGLIPSGAAELFEGMSMIIFVAIAVCMYIYSAIRIGRWDFLREQKCHIDDRTVRHIKMERVMYKRTHVQLTAAGVLLILSSVVPWQIFMRISPDFKFMDNLSMALFLILVSIGAFLLVMTFFKLYVYSSLLKLNDRNPHAPEVYRAPEARKHYNNQLIEKGMSVYWPTITCFYISMSFATYAWGISWIIWPMAWIIADVISRVFKEKN